MVNPSSHYEQIICMFSIPYHTWICCCLSAFIVIFTSSSFKHYTVLYTNVLPFAAGINSDSLWLIWYDSKTIYIPYSLMLKVHFVMHVIFTLYCVWSYALTAIDKHKINRRGQTFEAFQKKSLISQYDTWTVLLKVCYNTDGYLFTYLQMKFHTYFPTDLKQTKIHIVSQNTYYIYLSTSSGWTCVIGSMKSQGNMVLHFRWIGFLSRFCPTYITHSWKYMKLYTHLYTFNRLLKWLVSCWSTHNNIIPSRL